jgi:hypothetical protein
MKGQFKLISIVRDIETDPVDVLKGGQIVQVIEKIILFK